MRAPASGALRGNGQKSRCVGGQGPQVREFVSPPIHLPHSPLNLGIETRTLHHACELSDVKVQRILGFALARQVLRDQRSVLQQKIPPPAGDRRQEHRRLRAPEATPKVPRWIVHLAGRREHRCRTCQNLTWARGPRQPATGGRPPGGYNLGMHAEYDALLAELLDACRRHYGARLVALAVYGSVGRGTPRWDSDVDLLVVANGLPAGRFPRVDDFRAVEQAVATRIEAARDAGLHAELSPIFKTPAELLRGTPLLLDMTEDAKNPPRPGSLPRERARRPQGAAHGVGLPANLAGRRLVLGSEARLQVGRRHRALLKAASTEQATDGRAG